MTSQCYDSHSTHRGADQLYDQHEDDLAARCSSALRLRSVDFIIQRDSDVISMPAGFRRHLVGKTLINVFTVIALKYALLAR